MPALRLPETPDTIGYYRECEKQADIHLPVKRLIDTHCHIYPAEIALKAVQSIDRFYEGLPAPSMDGTVSALLRQGKKDGVSRFVVHSVATTSEQVAHINEFVSQCVKDAGGALTGMGTLFPGSEKTAEDLDYLRSLKLEGVKLHPDITHFHADSSWAMQVYEICEDRGLPVCLHMGDYRYDYSNPERIAGILRTFPGLKLIGAHFGGWSLWEKAAGILSDFPNLVVDTSSSFYWLKPGTAKEIIRAYGSGRVMFGTDYPMWNRTAELEYLRRLDLEQTEYENICYRTCESLFRPCPADCTAPVQAVPDVKKGEAYA